MRKRIILGVQVTNRIKNALEVQEILTKFGCNIKTRLGLHEDLPMLSAQRSVSSSLKCMEISNRSKRWKTN